MCPMTLPEGGEDVPSLMQQLRDALHQIEASKNNSIRSVDWSVVEGHFRNILSSLMTKFEEVEAREEEYREKESKTRAFLSEREASVAVKEQDLLDRIQELRDAAVAAIARAQPGHESTSVEFVAAEDGKESKVSRLIDVDISSSVEGVASDVMPRPELIHFCEQMDAKGLLKFITENKKCLIDFHRELPIALESAAEPGQLVLDSLEGFYPPAETTQRGMHRSCVLLIEAMAALLARIDPGAQHLLNLEIKQQAISIAHQWKPKVVEVTDAANVYTLEANAFLQLLSTFRIASEFDEEQLCKLVLIVANSRQTPELCRALGLTHKIPGVIESLVASGKQLDALHFIQAFQLTEKFPPVSLLKTYLKDLRRNSQGKGGANNQEVVAIKAIMRCIEGYKLEAEYPLDPLQKRLAQLEKSKSDKKRPADFGRHQLKKPKPTGKYPRFHGAAVSGRKTPPVLVDRTAYVGMQERYSQAAAISYGYQVPSQSASDRQTPPALVDRAAYAGMPERYSRAAAIPYDYKIPSHSACGRQTPPALTDRAAAYAGMLEGYTQAAAIQYNYQVPGLSAHGQQATDQQTYYYPQEDRAAPTSYSAPRSNYSGYTASGMSSLHQPHM